jgi:hypothetical protein
MPDGTDTKAASWHRYLRFLAVLLAFWFGAGYALVPSSFRSWAGVRAGMGDWRKSFTFRVAM